MLIVLDLFFFLMIRRPPRSTLDRSSAASDVYKRQGPIFPVSSRRHRRRFRENANRRLEFGLRPRLDLVKGTGDGGRGAFFDHLQPDFGAVSYTHLRAHETVLDLVCRLLLEKKKKYRK